MKTMDPWHYPRTELAEQVFGMFESGLSTSLTFFAPRRMGKTEFLRKDIMPLAESRHHWKVFYFSFLDVGANADIEFTKSLARFAEETGSFTKTRNLLQRIDKIGSEVMGVKAEVKFKANASHISNDMKKIVAHLATKNHVLLLLDEVQTLAQHANTHFVAALRTALDIHKDTIKVIFTGSSQEGLRRMFSQTKAPFFHFGQNLPFPELGRGFTDHLAHMYEKITQRKLDANFLWKSFQEMQKIPQLIRALVERLALNPHLTLAEAKKQLLADVFSDRAFTDIWENCAALERLLLREIAARTSSLFSSEIREQFTKNLGITNLSISSIQSALRVLQRKNLIGRYPDRGGYFIDDPNFKNWLLQDNK